MIRTIGAGLRLELALLANARIFVLLALLASLNFLVGLSLFGLTGAHAPTALVNLDGPAAEKAIVPVLENAHRSFRVIPMSSAQAQAALQAGTIVDMIVVPPRFIEFLKRGYHVQLTVIVDNVNVDESEDVERAMPTVLLNVGRKFVSGRELIHVREHDLYRHDTDYIPFLTVSSLALVALVVAGILGALSVTRDWQAGSSATWKLWRVSPANQLALLIGKVLGAAMVAWLGVAMAVTVVIIGYGVVPDSFPLVIATMTLCVIIFACVGALIGALIRRTTPVVPLIFGLGMPLYVLSGALEPVRFDGERLFFFAHFVPTYYAVGAFEAAFHNLSVTPEPVTIDVLALTAFALFSLFGASFVLSRAGARQ